MEPRARAGKNVGKMNFSHNELAQLLYAHGDVKNPLPETVRVLDEILTDFMQSIAFEAARAAQYSGRQKIKYEDFEFAFRRNPAFLGKVQEVFEKQKEIKKAREILRDAEDDIIKDAADEEKKREKTDAAVATTTTTTATATATAATATAATATASKLVKSNQDDLLGDADDLVDIEVETMGKKK